MLKKKDLDKFAFLLKKPGRDKSRLKERRRKEITKMREDINKCRPGAHPQAQRRGPQGRKSESLEPGQTRRGAACRGSEVAPSPPRPPALGDQEPAPLTCVPELSPHLELVGAPATFAEEVAESGLMPAATVCGEELGAPCRQPTHTVSNDES